MNGKTTIKDVAKHAGVSSALVSMVINNYPNVSLRSVETVKSAMTDLGYKPSPVGCRQGLSSKARKTRVTNRVLFCVFGNTGNLFTTEVYLNALQGVERALRKHGKHLQIHFFSDEDDLKANFPTCKFDGIIFLGGDKIVKDKSIKMLRKAPCVQIMGTWDSEDLWWDHVSYDDAKVGKIAAEYLLNLGFDDYAVIQAQDTPRTQEVLKQIKDAGRNVSLVNLSYDENGTWHIPENDILDISPFPKGFFCYGDEAVPELYRQMLKHGKIPGVDFKVVSCDNDTLIMRMLAPQPASLDLHTKMIGEKAVEQLLWRIDNPLAGRVKLLLEPELRLPKEQLQSQGGRML